MSKVEVEKLLGQFEWKLPSRTSGSYSSLPVLKIVYHPTKGTSGRFELNWNRLAAAEMGMATSPAYISVSHKGDIILATNVPINALRYEVRVKDKKIKDSGYIIVNKDLIVSMLERLGLESSDLKPKQPAIHVQLNYELKGEADNVKVFHITKIQTKK